MANIGYWLLAVLMFGILVMLHEFGHFIAARMSGVTVEEFAVGFGPKLLSRKAKSGVVYSLRALPLGGFCRFAGELGEDDAADVPGAYNRAKVWQRALISLGGPLMNILTAIAALFLIYFAIGLPGNPIPVVGSTMEGLPAQAAGFEAGDRIVRVNDVEIATTEDASTAISDAGDSTVTFVLERGGQQRTVQVQPEWVESEAEGEAPRYMIGIVYQQETLTFGLGQSLGYAFQTTGRMATMILDVLKNLIVKQEGLDQLAGPLGTLQAVKEQTQSGGAVDYFSLAAMISVNLGLFNLLPIPGLDGSKLIFLLIEKIRGKALDPNKEGLVTLIGFGFLALLMVFVLYQDIVRLIS